MYVNTCRRCGETEMTAADASRRVEAAGEALRLCEACYAELRQWVAGASDLSAEPPAPRAAAPVEPDVRARAGAPPMLITRRR